jgi:hypothetical protein
MVAGWLRWAAVPCWLAAGPLWACSCPWLGAFLDVAPLAPLVVRAEVLRHGMEADQPTLVLRAKETLAGGLLDSGLVVAMGDGMHCRPDAALFPPGSEWVLALNGPGAKPGTGLALSHCGQYWLAVEGDHAAGTVDGPQGTTQTIPLADLRAALAVPRYAESFAGEIGAGEAYSHWFGPALEFALLPVGGGWEIAVRQAASPENLARLTPPLHFLPNPRDVEPWHLLPMPSGCAGRDPREAPGPRREFIYSRAVGTVIDSPSASRPVSRDEVEQIRRDGHGVMEILSATPGPVRDGCPTIGRLRFRVDVFGRR